VRESKRSTSLEYQKPNIACIHIQEPKTRSLGHAWHSLTYFTNSRDSNIVYLESAIRENNEAVPFRTTWYTPYCSHDH
jgi:hypothetical protein